MSVPYSGAIVKHQIRRTSPVAKAVKHPLFQQAQFCSRVSDQVSEAGLTDAKPNWAKARLIAPKTFV